MTRDEYRTSKLIVQSSQLPLQLVLRSRIEVRKRLIEHEQPWSNEHCRQQSNLLSISCRELPDQLASLARGYFDKVFELFQSHFQLLRLEFISACHERPVFARSQESDER